MGVLMERISAVETSLVQARGEASENLARAIRAEQRLAEAERRVDVLESASREGRRWWQRSGGGDSYRGLGTRIEQLLRLAEDQAAEVTAAARAEADKIRSAAVSDAARIRAAAI